MLRVRQRKKANMGRDLRSGAATEKVEKAYPSSPPPPPPSSSPRLPHPGATAGSAGTRRPGRHERSCPFPVDMSAHGGRVGRMSSTGGLDLQQ
jgi:hypothetical protein